MLFSKRTSNEERPVETSLYYITFRYYDPEIGRFISPDSVDYLDPSTINGLNLYAYCGNDPVNRWDPTGHFWISLLVGIAIGAVIGFGATVIADYDDNKKIFDGETNASTYMKNIALGGVFGGIFGGAGIVAGLFALGGYISGEMIQSSGDSTSLKYNDYRHIEDSYRLLGVRNKIKYIRDNNIVELSGVNEISLLLEWEAHNIAYYLDIFGMLRKHSKSVDFGG